MARTNRTVRRIVAGSCLMTPVVALVTAPWYVESAPDLGGVPSFYWYQFAWVPGGVAFMIAAHLLRGRDDGPGAEPDRERPPS